METIPFRGQTFDQRRKSLRRNSTPYPGLERSCYPRWPTFWSAIFADPEQGGLICQGKVANLQTSQAGAQIWSGMERQIHRHIRRFRRFSIFQPKILPFFAQITIGLRELVLRLITSSAIGI